MQGTDLKSLQNVAIGDIFGSMCVIFEETLSFKNCKISGWQKRYELIHFLSSRHTRSIEPIRVQIPWDS